jgi:hypothetical protein
MVSTLEPVLDDAAKAQLHAAMRTAILESADLPRAGSKQYDVRTMHAHGNRLAPELPGGKYGMPVIEYSHEANLLRFDKDNPNS